MDELKYLKETLDYLQKVINNISLRIAVLEKWKPKEGSRLNMSKGRRAPKEAEY